MTRAARSARRLPGRLERFYWGSGISDDVPALTYYLLISLAPFLLGVASLAALLDGGALLGEITERASRQLPPDLADAILGLVHRTYSDSPKLLALAIASCLWTCSGGVGVLERCLSRLLGRERFHPVLNRVRHLGLAAVLVITVLCVLIVAVQAAGAARALALPVTGAALPVLTFAMLVMTCWLMLRLSPRGGMHPLAALTGAVPAAVALDLVPVAVGVYVNHAGGVAAHQLFFTLVVLVVGCALAAQAILIGAGLACREQLRRERS